MYSKFAKRTNNPKLIKLVLIIDIVNMILIFALTLGFFLVYDYFM